MLSPHHRFFIPLLAVICFLSSFGGAWIALRYFTPKAFAHQYTIDANAFQLPEALQACAQEVEDLCSNILPGGGRLKKCLWKNQAHLSAACLQTIEKIENSGKQK